MRVWYTNLIKPGELMRGAQNLIIYPNAANARAFGPLSCRCTRVRVRVCACEGI